MLHRLRIQATLKETILRQPVLNDSGRAAKRPLKDRRGKQQGVETPSETTNAIYWLGSSLRIENFLAKLYKLHMGFCPILVGCGLVLATEGSSSADSPILPHLLR